MVEAEAQGRSRWHIQAPGGLTEHHGRRMAGGDKSRDPGPRVQIASAERDVRVDAAVAEERHIEGIHPVGRVAFVTEGDGLPPGAQRRADRRPRRGP